MARIKIRNKGELINEIKENNVIENSCNLSNNSREGIKLNQGKNKISIKLNNEAQNRNSMNKKSKEQKILKENMVEWMRSKLKTIWTTKIICGLKNYDK